MEKAVAGHWQESLQASFYELVYEAVVVVDVVVVNIVVVVVLAGFQEKSA